MERDYPNNLTGYVETEKQQVNNMAGMCASGLGQGLAQGANSAVGQGCINSTRERDPADTPIHLLLEKRIEETEKELGELRVLRHKLAKGEGINMSMREIGRMLFNNRYPY